MDFLVKVEDSQAPYFLELMKNLRRVKIERLSAEKRKLIREIRQSIEEVKAAERGEIQLRPARDFLREL
ncbi:MAG TPA: hypothetical protein VFD13_06750 [Candidatus Kapabacteria bacterium]|nr:hypothetical protein [Candidatus Kapabacteria bacterium]